MNKNTVKNFTSADLEDKSLGGTMKDKKARRSTIVPLILSLFAALALWIFVVGENNTCSDLSVQVRGNEQLLVSGYSVSSVKPANIDLVLRGKNDAVSQVLTDRSQVKATVNIFASGEDGENEDSYIFKNQEEVKPGKYFVEVQVKVPEGVHSSTKTVEVTISETASRSFDKKQGEIRINKTNYSFANGLHLRSEELSSSTVSVKGDSDTIDRIAYIGLNIDWLKEIQNDVTATLKPVAYDKYGAEVDGKFLSFEPAQVKVTIKVEKVKTVALALHVDPDDSTKYILSRGTLRIKGPVNDVDAFGDIYYLNEKEYTQGVKEIMDSYVISFENSKISLDGDIEKMLVKVTKVATEEKKLSFNMATSSILVLSERDQNYSFDSQWVKIEVTYIASEGKELTPENIIAVLDLKDMMTGSHTVPLQINFKNVGDFSHIKVADSITVKVQISDNNL